MEKGGEAGMRVRAARDSGKSSADRLGARAHGPAAALLPTSRSFHPCSGACDLARKACFGVLRIQTSQSFCLQLKIINIKYIYILLIFAKTIQFLNKYK
jgi:hypothetical protein